MVAASLIDRDGLRGHGVQLVLVLVEREIHHIQAVGGDALRIRGEGAGGESDEVRDGHLRRVVERRDAKQRCGDERARS